MLFLGILGLGIGGIDRVALWIGVGILAILLHELGHALVGRRFGLTPRVDVAGLGGVTSWSETGAGGLARTRSRSIAISVAGPAVGIVLGLVALALGVPWRIRADGSLASFAGAVWVFVSLGWGILNLLPILPLDGGRILQELLPGAPAVRRRRAAAVGVVLAGALALAALAAEYAFGAFVLGFFAWNNYRVARSDTAAARAADQTQSSLSQARALLADGQPGEALQVARRAVATRGRDPAWVEVVITAVQQLLDRGQDRDAVEIVSDQVLAPLLDEVTAARAVVRHPDRDAVCHAVDRALEEHADARRRGIAVLVHAQFGDLATADRLLADGPVSPQVRAVLERLRGG